MNTPTKIVGLQCNIKVIDYYILLDQLLLLVLLIITIITITFIFFRVIKPGVSILISLIYMDH